MAIAFVDPFTPTSLDQITAVELEQLRALDALITGAAPSTTLIAVRPDAATRYRVVDGDAHLYDAGVHRSWLPLAVFAPGGTEVLAWWGDQDSDAVAGFAHVADVEAAHRAVTESSD